MDTQDGSSSWTDQVLTEHHQRCTRAIVRLHLLAAGDGDAIATGETVREVEQVIREVLDEVAAAEQRVLALVDGTYRARSAARLLGGLLVRLTDAAQQVIVALRAGNVSWLRRNVARFDALTQEARAVQLDVYRSTPVARRPHPRMSIATRQAANRG